MSSPTAKCDGYMAPDLPIRRPSIVGIAVPGMPAGSPGMEVASRTVQPYDVVAFAKDGSTRVFSSHGR